MTDSPPCHRFVFWLTTALAFSTAVRTQGVTVAPTEKRFAYLLAGQSNTRKLTDAAPGCGNPTPGANVSFYTALATSPIVGFCAFPPPPSEPIQYLMQALGQLHAPHHVDVVLVGLDSSALLERNILPGSQAWVDSLAPSNAATLIHTLPHPDPFGALLSLPSVTSLLRGTVELHIVWCHGETDCYPGATITAAEYWLWAQLVFAAIAAESGHTNYHVHLVTLGSIESPLQDSSLANQVRDAFFEIDHSPLMVPWPQASITTVAHYYDLPHMPNDAYHLTPCGYFTLAQRIADGIQNPGLLPKVTDGPLVVISDRDLQIDTTVPLAPNGMDATRNHFFDVLVNGQPITNFATQAQGSRLLIHVSTGGLLSAQAISVRHVPGSGHGRNWASGVPPHGTSGGLRPLEPFVKTL